MTHVEAGHQEDGDYAAGPVSLERLAGLLDEGDAATRGVDAGGIVGFAAGLSVEEPAASDLRSERNAHLALGKACAQSGGAEAETCTDFEEERLRRGEATCTFGLSRTQSPRGLTRKRLISAAIR